MTDVETLAERLRTVERTVTDGTTEFPDVTELAELETRIESVEDRVDELDARTAELEAATQAVRGYVGNVRSVNEDIEQRADAALAATDRLEARIDEELTSSPPDRRQNTESPRRTAATGEQNRSAGTAPPSTRTTRSDIRSRAPGTVDDPRSDFAAITDGGDGDEDGTGEPGLLERIRSVL